LAESSGEERARIFVQDLVVTQLYGLDINELWNPADSVGNLTDILKREGKAEPEFRLIKHSGQNSVLAVYYVGVYSDKNFIAEGKFTIMFIHSNWGYTIILHTGAGESLEIAKEMAAREALKQLFHTEDSMKALPFGRQLNNIQSKIVQLENQPNLPLSKWISEKVTSAVH
jgi:large subunit ribosomal protein L44